MAAKNLALDAEQQQVLGMELQLELHPTAEWLLAGCLFDMLVWEVLQRLSPTRKHCVTDALQGLSWVRPTALLCCLVVQ